MHLCIEAVETNLETKLCIEGMETKCTKISQVNMKRM